MNKIAREYDNIEDVRNFLSTVRSIKFLQTDSELFYKIEGVGERSGQTIDLDDYIESLNLCKLKELDKQVVDIGGNSIRFAVAHFSSSFKHVI